MIPNKNLFIGASGKSQFIEASKCFTTPHSINVPVQYSINTNLIGEFVASSLDGRLWCLKRSTRYTFFALKWNPDSLLLEFAASLARSGETFLARGLDWILTDKSFIRVLNDVPYIAAYNLFDDNSALSHEINISHWASILPPIGDFQIINNLLLRRDNNGTMLTRFIPLDCSDKSRPSLDVFISLPLALDKTDFHIIAHNESLWGTINNSIGRVVLLPAVFLQDGSIQSFYLAFLPDSIINGEDSDYAPAFIDETLYAYHFDSAQLLCSKSKDSALFSTASVEWIPLSEHNGKIFLDALLSMAVLLDDYGLTLLDNDTHRFDCYSLPQWVAPAGSLDALDANLFVASDDSSTFVTLLDSGLSREVLQNKILPLSAPAGFAHRFSIGLSTSESNRNILNINQISSDPISALPVLWDNSYKHALDLELLNVIHDVPISLKPIWYEQNENNIHEGTVEVYSSIAGINGLFFTQQDILCKCLAWYWNYSNEHPFWTFDAKKDYRFNIYFSAPDIVTEAAVDVYYFDPANGNISLFDSLHAAFDFQLHFIEENFEGFQFVPEKVTYPYAVGVLNGKIGFECETLFVDNNNHIEHSEFHFIPVKDIPEHLLTWCIPNDSYTYYSGHQGCILDKISSSYAYFHESSSILSFALECTNVPDITNTNNITSIPCSVPYCFDSNRKKKFLHNLHFAVLEKNTKSIQHLDFEDRDYKRNSTSYQDVFDFYIFRSTLYPDAFNFESAFRKEVSS